MSKKRLAAAVLAAAMVAIGFQLGRYAESSSAPRQKPATPAYAGPRPHARFETPRGAAESRGAVLDALREADAFARAWRLSELLSALGPEAVPEVRAAIENRAIDRRSVEVALLLRFWAAHEPAEAATWALREAPPGDRSGAVDAVFEPWAKADPEAAWRRVRETTMRPGEGLETAEIAVVRGWFESGLPGLEQAIRDLGPGPQQQRALGVFARKTIQRGGPEAVAHWAESIPDEDETVKLEAFRQVGAELAKSDPAAARAWCDAHCEGAFGTGVRKLIAQHWAVQDPQAAMQWLSTAPVGEERDRAVKEAYQRWFRKDRKGLLSWLTAMGVDGVEPWFQPALATHAIWMGAKDPTEGLKWAAVITDDGDREHTFVAIAWRWRTQDESAAEAWIEQSPLSDEARERVRAPTAPPLRAEQESRSGTTPPAS